MLYQKPASPRNPPHRHKFTAADAVSHHPAAHLMTRPDRQLWAACVNRMLRRGASVEEAIADGNLTLTAILDRDADLYQGASLAQVQNGNEAAIRGRDGRFIADDPTRPASARRQRDQDFDNLTVDLERHPQLVAVLERQRAAAGRQ